MASLLRKTARTATLLPPRRGTAADTDAGRAFVTTTTSSSLSSSSLSSSLLQRQQPPPAMSSSSSSSSFAPPRPPLTPQGPILQPSRGCASVLDKGLRDDIAKIIASDRVVIFLTGSPERPQCRFTAALCDLLRQIGLQYSFVDIVEDEEVCEGLKLYSDWPTYPQIYVDQQLIGGYDIIKSMMLSGELTQMLKEKQLL